MPFAFVEVFYFYQNTLAFNFLCLDFISLIFFVVLWNFIKNLRSKPKNILVNFSPAKSKITNTKDRVVLSKIKKGTQWGEWIIINLYCTHIQISEKILICNHSLPWNCFVLHQGRSWDITQKLNLPPFSPKEGICNTWILESQP